MDEILIKAMWFDMLSNQYLAAQKASAALAQAKKDNEQLVLKLAGDKLEAAVGSEQKLKD